MFASINCPAIVVYAVHYNTVVELVLLSHNTVWSTCSYDDLVVCTSIVRALSFYGHFTLQFSNGRAKQVPLYRARFVSYNTE